MKQVFSSAIIVLFLTACAESNPSSNDVSRELTFSVGSTPLTPAGSITRSTPIESDYDQPLYMVVTSEPVGQEQTTRGTEVTTANINTSGSTFVVRAYNAGGSTVQSWCDGITATYNTTDALFHTGQNWSSTSGNFDFYVWCPQASNNGLSVNGKTITYNISGLASSDMPDLLGAKATTNYAANHGRVDLTLNHLLTPVCFKLAANYRGGTIKSIKFSSLVTSATQTIGSGTWTPSTTGEYITQTLNTAGSSTEVQIDGTQYFMMIPQTIAAGTVITITTEKGGVANTLKYTTPEVLTWRAGETVTYTISTSTISSLSVDYPMWKDGSANIYGSVVRYDTGESFGLFAVDQDGKIVISNAEVTATFGSTTATCDLTTGTNATNLNNYILSQNYTYYLMYPYNASAVPATLGVGQTAPGNTADAFFANVVSGWSVSSTQNTFQTFKAQDLQIAKATVTGATASAKMAHKMGIAKITLGTKSVTASEVREYTSQTTHNVYTTSSSTTDITATSRLDATSTSRLLDASGGFWTIVKATGENNNNSVILNSVSSAEDADAWESAVTVSDIGYGKYKNTNVLSSRSTSPSLVANFGYNDQKTYYQIELEAGTYKLEVWGAQGGDGREWNRTTQVDGAGGKGGYTCGTLTLSALQTLYVCVGGQGEWAIGTKGHNPEGGYNGGGKGGTESEAPPEDAGGGGGATHIAKSLRNTGILSDYREHKDDVLIVAGGGGGASGTFPVGTVNGGYSVLSEDLSGLANYEWFSRYSLEDNPRASFQAMYGGDGGSTGPGTTYHYGNSSISQYKCGVIPCSAPGVSSSSDDTYFGKGQDGCTHQSDNIGGTGGGGGGWYGGTYGGHHKNQVSAAGAGGSGHVSNSLTNTGGIVGANTGNGKARITKL